jgi:uncharacterized protein YjbJ (UPF0337 family)
MASAWLSHGSLHGARARTDSNIPIAHFINAYSYFITMSQDEIKGKGKQIKGKVREEVGKLTDNKGEQVKGKVEQAQGKAREEIGKAERRNKNN